MINFLAQGGDGGSGGLSIANSQFETGLTIIYSSRRRNWAEQSDQVGKCCPNVYKSCPKNIGGNSFHFKFMFLNITQNVSTYLGFFSNNIVTKYVQKRPIWSHWTRTTYGQNLEVNTIYRYIILDRQLSDIKSWSLQQKQRRPTISS